MAGIDPLRVVLLDIEGTVCPISFVKDVLFPYALQSLSESLGALWDTEAFAPYKHAFPQEYQTSPDAFKGHVEDLVAADVKAPYLKALQGYLWEDGYRSGKLRAPIFDDVSPAITSWHAAGLTIMIYSSGSVPAQKLFFGHTTADPSDLTPLITDWFDTVNAGPKTEQASYSKIASKYPGIPSSQWLFLSDNLAEVRAAKEAGMLALPVVRPGNAPIDDVNVMSSAVRDFGDLKLQVAPGS
ncbi:probable Enolase-phosphatase E1 [Cephalotrichum gorgonifer]|uniref:Enolase-phosphatase E1 n=1 Tax=Cephalotrichum gorgonifer TaxID=2041049 RepID=A0AAE8SRL9_9PEZI|nr:probable Enolase-phosphatase E1 [Cephalotrichum gorgonifer]